MTEATNNFDYSIDDGIAGDGTWDRVEEEGKTQREIKKAMGIKIEDEKNEYAVGINFGKNSKQNLEDQIRKLREKTKQKFKNDGTFTEEEVEEANRTREEFYMTELIAGMIEDILENGLSERSIKKLQESFYLDCLPK